jgi:hypothetical protein
MHNKEDKVDNIITPSVEISDLSPPLPQSYDDLREIDESAGATTLSQEDMAKIFKGKTNPTLKVLANANNTITIQNPTDTKHELIIDTGSDVLPSSDDIAPHGIGQLAFSPNMTKPIGETN